MMIIRIFLILDPNNLTLGDQDGISPRHSRRTWKAIQEGGEGAVAAMARIMNHVGRQAFKHSFKLQTRITEAGFTSARTRFW
jgi:methylphosphotriester-DNA--protein-cysteine methyltransferase